MAASDIPLSPDDKALLSMRTDEFHVALARGSSGDWSPYLEGLTGDVRLAVLTELAVIELGHRWENGEQPSLEEYVQRYPELGPPGSEPYALREELERCHDRAGLSAMATRHSKRIEMPAERVAPPTSPAAETESDSMRATRTVLASRKQPVFSGAPGGEGLLGVAQNYELIRELGRGAYGEVWLAKKMPSGIEKAVKILHQPADQDTAQRELRSLELIKNLRHPFLLATEDFWVANNKLYIVSELADSSLRRRLVDCKEEGQPGIPEDELFGYMFEAAEGFDYLHSKMITHRDVKPDNILIVNGHTKVADFGLARQHDSPEVAVMSFAGTPAYMAPEVWGGEGGPPSDLYGFAMSYIELRQGRTPFKLGKLMEVMQSHKTGQFDFAEIIQEPERAVLRRALAQNPADRYPSCLSFAEDLAESLGRNVRRKSGPSPALPPLANFDIGDSETLVAPRPPRSKVWVVGGVVALVAAIGIGAILVNGKKGGIGSGDVALPPGTAAVDKKMVQLADGRQAPEFVEAKQGDEEVRFRLITPTNTGVDSTPPFYISQSKVWNRLYKTGDDKPREEPGGPDAPVVTLTANEAATFAALLGGRLPTPTEWDNAAGFYNPEGDTPIRAAGEIRIKRPLPAIAHGEAALNTQNQNDLMDIAGNGREWTCAVLPARGEPLKLIEGPGFQPKQLVVLRGRNFTLSSPLTFEILKREQTDPQTQFADVPSPYTGFRIVLPLPK